VTGFVFHLPGSVLADRALLKPYYVKLTEGLVARGHAVRLALHDRATLAREVEADGDIHIVDHGTRRHSRVLNTGIAYIYPFWNLDLWGIRALSSIAEKSFDPAGMDADAVQSFANRLRKRWVVGRKSRYEQPSRPSVVPAGCIAVFLQSETQRRVGETCYLTTRQMIKALLARDDPRRVVIKPHPLDDDCATRRFVVRIAAKDARVELSDGNIHDILARAAVCVTINSAVGLEAMLHGVPVVLCGRADFHHAAVTVIKPEGMAPAILRAEAETWPHDAFLYWYLNMKCLNAGKNSLVDDFLARVGALSVPA